VDGEGRDGSHIRKAKHKSRRHKKHKKEKMSESRKASVSGGAPTSNISGQQEEAGAWVDPLTDYDDPGVWRKVVGIAVHCTLQSL
jgi:hypothetical protein